MTSDRDPNDFESPEPDSGSCDNCFQTADQLVSMFLSESAVGMPSPYETTVLLWSAMVFARVNGILALETWSKNVSNAWLTFFLDGLVDGVSPEVLKCTLNKAFNGLPAAMQNPEVAGLLHFGIDGFGDFMELGPFHRRLTQLVREPKAAGYLDQVDVDDG